MFRFDHIHAKIKTLAVVMCALGVVASLLLGFSLMFMGAPFQGVLFFILGSLLSWVGSFVLYGFGRLIENSELIKEELYGWRYRVGYLSDPKGKTEEVKIPECTGDRQV